MTIFRIRVPAVILFLIMATAALLVRAPELAAEAIFMKDGRVIYGRILFQDNREMQVRTRYGIIRLLKLDIQRIDYDLGLGTVSVVMKDNRTINGTLISITAAKVVVREDTTAAPEHDVPRTDIESLVLHRFEGRRDNVIGIAGGFVKTTNSLADQTPYSAADVSVFYRRPIDISPYFFWGLSASYIRLKSGTTPLENANMTLNPILLELEAGYPLLELITDAAWARGLLFSIHAAGGMSYVTLTESKENRTGSYYTLQPGVGLGYSFIERVYVILRANYLYIHQSALPYEGVRAQLGAGYIF